MGGSGHRGQKLSDCNSPPAAFAKHGREGASKDPPTLLPRALNKRTPRRLCYAARQVIIYRKPLANESRLPVAVVMAVATGKIVRTASDGAGGVGIAKRSPGFRR